MRTPFETGFRVSSPYGYRTDPITGQPGAWHGGVDLVGNDRVVRSVAAGTVLRSRIVTDATNPTSEWGNYVCIQGDDGVKIYYCHLEYRYVADGDRVTAGQPIGIEGATGKATGMHLHFEVRNTLDVQLNPCTYLGIQNVAGYEWKPQPPYLEQASDWARDAVSWAVEKGILKGRGGDDYALQQPITREEMCVMLYRAREVL